MSNYYTPKKPEPQTCPHNEGVACSTLNRLCDRCGFNPKVAQERLEKYCEEHGINLQEKDV